MALWFGVAAAPAEPPSWLLAPVSGGSQPPSSSSRGPNTHTSTHVISLLEMLQLSAGWVGEGETLSSTLG